MSLALLLRRVKHVGHGERVGVAVLVEAGDLPGLLLLLVLLDLVLRPDDGLPDDVAVPRVAAAVGTATAAGTARARHAWKTKEEKDKSAKYKEGLVGGMNGGFPQGSFLVDFLAEDGPLFTG